MGKTFTMKEQLADGQAGEALLDDYFKQWFIIKPATMEQERLGIDRIFLRRGDDSGTKLKVQYKSDSVAAKTGNVFVETYSMLNYGRYGWAWTCQADMLIYWVRPKTLYMVRPIEIRAALPHWMKVFPRKLVKNPSYITEGYVVPLWKFEEVCDSVRTIEDATN